MPDDGATSTAGPVTVRGYAFAGGARRVARVDVSPDGGRSWTRARLDDPAGPWAWTLWNPKGYVNNSRGRVRFTAEPPGHVG